MSDRIYISYHPDSRRGIDVTEPTEVLRQTSNPDGTGQTTQDLTPLSPRVRVTNETIIVETESQRITAQHGDESNPARGHVIGNITNVTTSPFGSI